jgi:SsrA-binding protein
MAENKEIKIISENRKARHDYNVVEAFEAGIELRGTEVKSLRQGKVNLKDSYVQISRSGELIVFNMHISPYDFGNINNHDPLRTRRLLMHRREIDRLFGKVKERGFTLVPLKLYFKHGRVKMEIALATGKKNYDKRRDMAERDAKRELDRVMKARNR